jgi:hypothetical protein
VKLQGETIHEISDLLPREAANFFDNLIESQMNVLPVSKFIRR